MHIFVDRRLIAMLSRPTPYILHHYVVLARLLVPNHTHLIHDFMPLCTIVHRPVAPGAARREHRPTTDQQHLFTRDDGWRPVPGRQRVVRGIGQDLKRKAYVRSLLFYLFIYYLFIALNEQVAAGSAGKHNQVASEACSYPSPVPRTPGIRLFLYSCFFL